jgi:hypothetical protein
MNTEMAESERHALAMHERTITEGLATFVAVGQALRAIQDESLYRGTHATFALYIRDKWGMKCRNAYYFIEAAEVATNIGLPGDPPPMTHMTALSHAKPEQQAEIYEHAVKTAPGGVVTASHVAGVVAARTRPEVAVRRTFSDKIGNEITDARLIDEFRAACLASSELRGALLELQRKFHTLASNPISVFLNWHQIRADLNNIGYQIFSAKPYATCPYCGGDGERCKICRKCGWVPKGIYERIPGELR